MKVSLQMLEKILDTKLKPETFSWHMGHSDGQNTEGICTKNPLCLPAILSV
jgi:hypothetical protein